MRQPVSLTEEDRQHLHLFVHRGKAHARTLTRARILLKVDQGWKDQEIAATFDICQATVANVYKRSAEGQLEAVRSCTIGAATPTASSHRAASGVPDCCCL
jgi:hypothetical protein